jgi:hypothetical protein
MEDAKSDSGSLSRVVSRGRLGADKVINPGSALFSLLIVRIQERAR